MTARTSFPITAALLALVVAGCATDYKVRHTTAVTNMTRITTRATPEVAPEVSPDGSKVVFAGMVRNEEGRRNNYDLWISEPRKKLHQYMRATDNECDDCNPVWGPQGKVIVFDSRRTRHSAVWEKPADGIGGCRQVTGEDMFDDLVTPDISVHGDFCYAATESCKPSKQIEGRYSRPHRIWVRAYGGQNATELCVGITPKWSPDGSRIVFASTGTKTNWDIWTIDKNGSNLTQITSHPANDIQPTWSPDGKRIAFSSNRASSWLERLLGDHNYDIWVVNARGGNAIQLTNYSKFEGHPSWSIDGDIFFHSYGGFFLKNWDIWRMTTRLPGPVPR